MHALFEVAAGTVAGRDHVLAGRNNQDAYCWACLDQALLAVVCDGCGSGAHSEVGAQLGARLLVQAMRQALGHPEPAFWPRVRHDLLAQLRHLAERLGGNFARTVQDYLLFTIVGALLTPLRTCVFSLGDGVIVVNGNLIPLGPFADNAPPYLAYALLDTSNGGASIAPFKFQIQRLLPTAAVQSLLLGTDGLEAFAARATHAIPGQSTVVGPLSQFWQAERYFTNPDAVRRTLTVVNREVVRPNWAAQGLERQPGLLPDDTTLIVIRRRVHQPEEASRGRLGER